MNASCITAQLFVSVICWSLTKSVVKCPKHSSQFSHNVCKSSVNCYAKFWENETD